MTLRSILFAIVVFLLVLPASAEPPMTTLRIEVKTLKDKPIERASVILNFLEGRNLVKLGRKDRRHWETKTGQDGVAKCTGSQPGDKRSYNVQFGR